jgi:hypothetical protein
VHANNQEGAYFISEEEPVWEEKNKKGFVVIFIGNITEHSLSFKEIKGQ